eukprot:scaffold377_cov563-Prasinococcus_capsulatus_cf.AAC.28
MRRAATVLCPGVTQLAARQLVAGGHIVPSSARASCLLTGYRPTQGEADQRGGLGGTPAAPRGPSPGAERWHSTQRTGLELLDRIYLKGVQFYGYHGALPEENILGQRFTVHAELYMCLGEAGVADELSKTASYAESYE